MSTTSVPSLSLVTRFSRPGSRASSITADLGLLRSRLDIPMATRRRSWMAHQIYMRSPDIAIGSQEFQACLSYALLLPSTRIRSQVRVIFGENSHQLLRFDTRLQLRSQSDWFRHAPGGEGAVLPFDYMHHRLVAAVGHSKYNYIPRRRQFGSYRRLSTPSASAECKSCGFDHWHIEAGNDETIRNHTCSSATRCWRLLFRTE